MNNYMNPMGGMPYSNTYQTSNYSYRLPMYKFQTTTADVTAIHLQ